MAHFAELDEQNNVLRVIVISNEDIKNDDGSENEILGEQLARQITGTTSRWIQASYNRRFRQLFPDRPGFTYNEQHDAFIEPRPFPSWVLNDQGVWKSPVIRPDDNRPYEWDEETGSWKEVPIVFVSNDPIPDNEKASVVELP